MREGRRERGREGVRGEGAEMKRKGRKWEGKREREGAKKSGREQEKR